MTTYIYMFLLACFVLMNGCSWDSQARIDKTQEKEGGRMIKINNITVKEETLTLDYQVVNPFTNDIWICEDIDIYGRYDVETRITDREIQIKLRFNLECNILLHQGVLAKYRRLSQGDSNSGRILLKLPITNASPVYDFSEDGKKHKRIILNQAFFEVGYFEGNLLNILSESIEKGKQDPNNEGLYSEALILEEIKKAQSHDIVYLPHLWRGLRKEKSMKVIITDVDIPCSVAIDDK
jgi:hypothetical protein